MREQQRQTVVVIGGQFAGRRVRLLLQRHFDVVLIDDKDYFEFTPSVHRCLVDPGKADEVLVPHPKGTLTGRVVRLEETGGGGGGGAVMLADGRRVAFDFCVLCTGSGYAYPFKAASDVAKASISGRKEELQRAADELAAARSVVVIGGGTVGVEVAAEVVGRYGAGAKQVVLITSKDRLLERLDAAVSSHAARWLSSRGVELVYRQRADIGPRGERDGRCVVTTPSGRRFDADVVFTAIGYGGDAYTTLWHGVCASSSSSSSSSSSFSSSQAEQTRRGVPVEPTLQVRGCCSGRVFACGDCIDTPFEKTAFTADSSATVAARNVLRLSRGQPLLSYPDAVFGAGGAPATLACVSLYKWSAVFQMNWLVLPGPLAAASKALIEFLVIRTMRDIGLFILLWRAMEECTILASRFLVLSQPQGRPRRQ